MPTVWRIRGNYRVAIFADDHAPPHFHILGPECSLVVEIYSLVPVRGSGPAAVVAEALALAAGNQAALLAKWRELNERDDD